MGRDQLSRGEWHKKHGGKGFDWPVFGCGFVVVLVVGFFLAQAIRIPPGNPWMRLPSGLG